jgi:hypothetical protein
MGPRLLIVPVFKTSLSVVRSSAIDRPSCMTKTSEFCRQ